QRGLDLGQVDAGVVVQHLGDAREVFLGEEELPFDELTLAVPAAQFSRHAASRSSAGRTRSSEIRLIMRPSTAMIPLTKVRTCSQPTSGVGWIRSSVTVRMSDTASTSRPTIWLAMRQTMITWRASGSVAPRPRRADRSMIGSTAPRRLITPRTKSGVRGRGVAAVQPRISRTDMMSTQNSCSPMRKEISSRRSMAFWAMSVMVFELRASGASGGDVGGQVVGGAAGHDRVDVQDQGHAAVAQDGRGGDADHVAVVGFQALDHHLALALDGVHQQGGAGRALLH